MEEELIAAVPCSSLAVESTIRVATAGGIYGFIGGLQDARRIGLTGLPQASYVVTYLSYFFAYSVTFQGLWLSQYYGNTGVDMICAGLVSGVFTFTQCGLQRYRGRNDWVNALTAGAVAGAAVAVGTRNWTQVVGTAGLVSAFSVLANYSRSN